MKVERLRYALGGLLLVAVLGLGEGFASAEGGGIGPPAPAADRTSISTDAALAVTIEEPQRKTIVPAGTPVPVTGTVTAAPVPVNYIYVIDVSSGTGLFGGDCGDQNADGVSDTILDCEIAGLTALNNANLGDDAAVSLVTFDSAASVVDLSPAAGTQTTTKPDADADGNGTPDVVDALQTLRTSEEPSNFDSPLLALQSLIVEREINLVFFVSDGQSDGDTGPSTGPGAPLQALVDAGVTIVTFAVNPAPGGCDPGQPLSTIAVGSGGRCAEVADPDAMAVPVDPPLAVDRVEIEVNGSVVLADLDSSGQFSHVLSPDLFRLGRNNIIARAYGSDGEVAEAQTFVIVKGPAAR